MLSHSVLGYCIPSVYGLQTDAYHNKNMEFKA